MAALAKHAARDPDLLDALPFANGAVQRAGADAEAASGARAGEQRLLCLLQHWATLKRGAPTVVALVTALARRRRQTLPITNLGLKAAATCGDMDAALELYTGLLSSPVQPNVLTYGSMISAYGKACTPLSSSGFDHTATWHPLRQVVCQMWSQQGRSHP